MGHVTAFFAPSHLSCARTQEDIICSYTATHSDYIYRDTTYVCTVYVYISVYVYIMHINLVYEYVYGGVCLCVCMYICVCICECKHRFTQIYFANVYMPMHYKTLALYNIFSHWYACHRLTLCTHRHTCL